MGIDFDKTNQIISLKKDLERVYDQLQAERAWQPIETAPPYKIKGGWYLICGIWQGEPMVRETDGFRDCTLWRNLQPYVWRPMPEGLPEPPPCP